jgi:hypothetical protein
MDDKALERGMATRGKVMGEAHHGGSIQGARAGLITRGESAPARGA